MTNLITTAEKLALALRGTPMLMVLLIVCLSNLGMNAFILTKIADVRSAERAELVAAFRSCLERKN